MTDPKTQDLPPGAERRTSPRVDVDFPIAVSESVTVSVTATGGGESVRGRARDLCKDAVLVEADDSFPRGTELNVVLESNGSGRALELSGKVVRMGPRKTGVMAIAFTDVSPENQAAIDTLLE